jgi:predicted acetyltransferase
MAVEIRNYLDGFDDREAALRAMAEMDETAFGEGFTDDEIASPIFGVMDDDRTFLAWDGAQVVGTSANFSLDVSVPGGSLATAGVTFIGVRPTHRRQGVMSAMLDTLHRDGINRKEPLAALWAADPAIYPRFGYGCATSLMRTEIPCAFGALDHAPSDESLRFRMLPPADSLDTIAPIYNAVRSTRGGVPALDERWHARQTWDPASNRNGASALFDVLVEDDDGVRGFLRYNIKPDWTGAHSDGTVNIYRLMSTDPAAHAALWRYALSLDLVSKVSWFNAPVDDPIQLWLQQPRHAMRQLEDSLYIRILDLPTALAARTYTTDIDIVLEVTDDRFPDNAGRWRLSGDSTGATCERTSAAAALSLDIRLLGAAYLGGAPLPALRLAGWVEEHTPGALVAVDQALRTPLAPYCPFVF